MPDGIVQINEGTGKKLQTFTKTVGANTVEQEVTVTGESFLPAYAIATGSGISLATANSHVLQIMAGASLRVYLRRLVVYQVSMATAAASCDFLLLRLTTAGTGGTALTANLMDPADAAAGCSGMTLPTVKGTEGVGFFRGQGFLMQTIAVSVPPLDMLKIFDLDFDRARMKPPIIAAGAANGIVLKNVTAVAGATIVATAYVTEAAY